MTNQEELEFIEECSSQLRYRRERHKKLVSELQQELVRDLRLQQISETGRNIVQDCLDMAAQIRILRDEANWGRR